MVQLNIGLMIFLVTLEYARGSFPCPEVLTVTNKAKQCIF